MISYSMSSLQRWGFDFIIPERRVLVSEAEGGGLGQKTAEEMMFTEPPKTCEVLDE